MDDDSISDGLASLLSDVGWARRLAAALVGEHDGEDLVQRVLTGAVRRGSPMAREAEGGARVRGYWRRALRFEAANLRRGQARRRVREEAASKPLDHVPDPAEVAEHLDQRRRLAEHLLALPEEQRYLLALRYEQDLDSSEIGRRLNLSASTVRTSLVRARHGLRKRLEQDDPDWSKSMSLLAAGAVNVVPQGIGTASVSLAIMNAKIATTIGILGLLAIAGWGLFGLDGRDELSRERLTLAESESPSLEEAALEVGAPAHGVEERAPVGAETSRVGRGGTSPEEKVQSTPFPSEFRLLARLLDESGQTLPGAELVLTKGPGLVLVADSQGRIDARVDADSVLAGRNLSWRAEASQERFRIGAKRIGPESVVQLGDLQLPTFARYSGRVVDSSGAGVDGLTLSITHDVSEDPFAGPVQWAGGQTDEDGYYSNRVRRVQGPVSIRVSTRGWTSASLVAEPVLGESLTLPDLVAERTPKPIRPRVLLVNDAGDPISDAQVHFDFRGRVRTEEVSSRRRSSRGRAGSVLDPDSADDEIVEVLALAPACASWVSWRGRVGELRPEKVLVVDSMHQLQLRVVDASAEALEVKGIVVRTWLGGCLAEFSEGEELVPTEDGVYSAGVPARPIELEIDLGPGYPRLSRRLDGPPGSVLELSAGRPHALLHGRVQAAGHGMAGARISLHRGDRSGQSFVYNDFPIRFDGEAAVSTTSAGEDGAFELPLAVGSPSVLVVRADGYGLIDLDLGAEPTAEELVIELRPTGRVHGQVRMADGSHPMGEGYVLLRGALDTRTGKFGDGGVIDESGLAPGEWYLRSTRLSMDEDDDSAYSMEGPGWSPTGRPDFIVRSGETTALDLVWPARKAGRLEGRMLVDGVPMSGWEITLTSDLGESLEGVDAYLRTKTGADGSYALDIPLAPKVGWRATSLSGTVSLSCELDREDLQDTLREVDLRTALLGLDGLKPGERVSYRVTLSNGVECLGRIEPTDASVGPPSRVPAGELVLLRTSGAWGEQRPPLGPYLLKPEELLNVNWAELQGE